VTEEAIGFSFGQSLGINGIHLICVDEKRAIVDYPLPAPRVKDSNGSIHCLEFG
jgi:hypothetical protein